MRYCCRYMGTGPLTSEDYHLKWRWFYQRIPGSTFDSDWFDSLNITAWFSYHVVSFRLHTSSTGLSRCTPIPCLLIPTWQLVKANGVTRNEPKIHVNSHYVTLFFSMTVHKSVYLRPQSTILDWKWTDIPPNFSYRGNSVMITSCFNLVNRSLEILVKINKSDEA